MVLPYDDSISIAANQEKTIELADRLGGQPAFYTKLTALTSNARLWLIYMSGAVLEFSAGLTAGLAQELDGYELKTLIVMPTSATVLEVHATTVPAPPEPEPVQVQIVPPRAVR